MTELRLKLEGMHCASCALLIEEELEGLDGVEKASASYLRQRAEVSFDAAQVGVAAILETIGELGYEARVAE
ncbi:MAG: heavy-metal-associated domain-containing protein [Gaiella sp.]